MALRNFVVGFVNLGLRFGDLFSCNRCFGRKEHRQVVGAQCQRNTKAEKDGQKHGFKPFLLDVKWWEKAKKRTSALPALPSYDYFQPAVCLSTLCLLIALGATVATVPSTVFVSRESDAVLP